ncbi:bacillithiol biosynthesis cysteine-adding enzyme BshC [Marinilongibacter aquaticus]|uniref:bacillithiol biosynthesis cysteine-adding enzyme BshC n=1 Tax=Marinilongibacter aquaticus TaxID=2975157 RepID=UPI0021BD5FDA|nr:bacillithiol biosynthesis cysteine-adding enzyme BshC [Marinilongibacter aquaticus]
MSEKAELKGFYNQFPKLENFRDLIENKVFTEEKRGVLVHSLQQQYAQLSPEKDFSMLLKENTFTVTTGHQLNIYSGPLYIIFKIVTIINLAKVLKKAYPEYNFVPVYWMATEDHDLEEIQSFRAFGQKHTWKTNQTGAVGRMHTQGLAEMAKSLGKASAVFEKAYSENNLLGDAVRAYMHELFGAEGLITLDADDAALKSQFQSVISDDLQQNSAFELVHKQSQKLEELGYKTQITAREINFFYLDKGLRERLVYEDNLYKVLNTEIAFSKEEIEQLIANEPERFSPNVVLRPLYEEVILPNLAYIGGPSEVPYWLQLKPVFDFYGVQFPALIPRNFALMIDKKQKDELEKLGLCAEDCFLDLDTLKKFCLKKQSAAKLDVLPEKELISQAFNQLKNQAEQIDPTLGRTTEAFQTKTVHLLESMEKKMVRAEKRNHEAAMRQVGKLKEELFPSGGLQERKENVIPFLEKNPNLINSLLNSFDPLDFSMNILQFDS